MHPMRYKKKKEFTLNKFTHFSNYLSREQNFQSSTSVLEEQFFQIHFPHKLCTSVKIFVLSTINKRNVISIH